MNRKNDILIRKEGVLMKKPKVKALAIKVGEFPDYVLLDNQLETFQKFVGGYIEVLPWGEALIVCNEEGKLQNLPMNRPLFYNGEIVDVICGDFLIVSGDDEGDFDDLPEELVEKFAEEFFFPVLM
jgi:hypothetical protein